MHFAKFLRAVFFTSPVAVSVPFPEGNEITEINRNIGTKWVKLMFQKVFLIFQVGIDTDVKINK